VGEAVEEPARGADGEVGVEGEELGVDEGFEAVDGEGFGEGEAAEGRVVEEHAVAGEAQEMAADGGVGGCQSAGGLAQASAFGDEGDDGMRSWGRRSQ